MLALITSLLIHLDLAVHMLQKLFVFQRFSSSSDDEVRAISTPSGELE